MLRAARSIGRMVGISQHPSTYNIDNFIEDVNKHQYRILFFDDSPANFESIKNGFEISDLGHKARSVLVPQTNEKKFNARKYLTTIMPHTYLVHDPSLSYQEYINNMSLFVNYLNYGFDRFNDSYVNGLTIEHLNHIIEWANLPNPMNKERVAIFDFDELLNKTSGPYLYDILFPIVEQSGTSINYFTSTRINTNHIIRNAEINSRKLSIPQELYNKEFTLRPSLLAAYYLFGSKERFEKIREMFQVFERNLIKFYILTNNGYAQSSRCFVEVLREVHPSFTIRSDPTMRVEGVVGYNSNHNLITHTNNPYKIKVPVSYFSKDGNIISARRFADIYSGRGTGGDKYSFLLSYFRNIRKPERISLRKLYNGTQNANSNEGNIVPKSETPISENMVRSNILGGKSSKSTKVKAKLIKAKVKSTKIKAKSKAKSTKVKAKITESKRIKTKSKITKK
jgi:hypothetical protein